MFADTDKQRISAFNGANSFAGTFRTSTGFTDCKNGVDANTVVFRSRFNGALVSAPSSGAQLNANRWAAGPWERFDAFDPNNQPLLAGSIFNNVKFRAHSNSRFVCAYTPDSNTPVRANATSINDPCVTFQVDNHPFGDHSFTFLPDMLSRFVQVGFNGSTGLFVQGTQDNNSTKFDVLTLGFPNN